MGVYWNAVGALGLANVLLAWTLAVVVFRARPDRVANQMLAMLLAVEGAFFVGGAAVVYFTTDQKAAYAAQALTEFMFPAVVAAYLLFLGRLVTPWAAPLRWRPVRAALWVGMFTLPLAVLARMDQFVVGVEATPYSLWEGVAGPWKEGVRLAGAVPLFIGLAIALDAWRRAARGSATRSQATWYAAAFGARDVGYLSGVALALLAISPPEPWGQVRFHVFVMVYYLALAYGLLRHQLLGIDLKVKWTLKRGTVVAALAAIFFIVKEGVEFLLPLEGLVPSLAGAALVAGLAFPVWRGAARIAERIMPGVDDTLEYRESRSREIYRAAVEELAGEGISPRERRVLDALCAKLEITTSDALVIEETVSQSVEVAE